MKKKPLIDENGEVRELTTADLKKFKKTSEVLPAELLAVLPKRGRPRKNAPKVSTTMRLDADVITFFKSRGKGWQTEGKMLEVLRQGKKILISVDEEMISNDYFLKFLERMKVEEVAQKSRLKEDDAMALAEEIKSDWWKKNKDQLLERIAE